jgi:osomolarity two-component system sensor histidine kinase NIK1
MSTLKGTVNSIVDQLSAFASEVTRVAQKMASNLTDQVQLISEVTKAVALGDLGKVVNIDMQGGMLDLKMTCQFCGCPIVYLANKVSRVSLEVAI